MRLSFLFVAFSALAACNGTGDDTDNPGNPNDLPDPLAGLVYDSACDGANDSDGVFHEVAGATTYWSGTFTMLDGDDLSGTESLVVFSNNAWEAAQPEVARDCTIVWNVVGKYETASDCASCDYRYNIDANLDTAATTCDLGYARAAYDESYSVSYDVNVVCAGSGLCDAHFAFSTSGNALADGNAAGNVAQYTTTRQCQFY